MVVLESAGTVCSWPRVYIPDKCRGVPVVVGIDEAGRGPVLGALVYCAAFWPESEHAEICKLGFDDSKQLKEGERDRFFDRIRNHGSIGWVIGELSAERISQEMMRRNPVSLNALSYDAVIWMLEQIRDGGNEGGEAPMVGDVYVDTVGDPETYRAWLTRALGNEFARFTIEKKADATYKVVSAASIIAKVTRDTHLKEWKWAESSVHHSLDFGSGYPGDEQCKEWLKQVQHPVFGFPNLIRFSWSTTRELLDKGVACPVTWECDDEDTGGAPPITAFFGAAGEKRPARSAFFTTKKLKHILPSDDVCN
jgi:ribonuclease H2 subunit A